MGFALAGLTFLASACISEAPDAAISGRHQAVTSTSTSSVVPSSDRASEPCRVTPMASSKPGKRGSCAKPSKPVALPTAAHRQLQSQWLLKRQAILEGRLDTLNAEERHLAQSLGALSAAERKRRMADAKDAHFGKAVLR